MDLQLAWKNIKYNYTPTGQESCDYPASEEKFGKNG
jgi:hypothetical protein